MEIALVQPEIPGNTGSVGRVCVGTNSRLHLVQPLGFDIDDRAVRRAGLDYWRQIDLQVHDGIDPFMDTLAGRRLHWFSVHGQVRYDRVRYGADDVLVFGCETRGFPAPIRERFGAAMIHLPVLPSIRSLNLANAVTAVLYEALRQQGFAFMDGADNQK
jgi:tRNA (cytidine/uridine-2'-O-)-methyltransferase